MRFPGMPPVPKMEGVGVFSGSKSQVKSRFKLIRHPLGIWVQITGPKASAFMEMGDRYALSGRLVDGRHIELSDMFPTETQFGTEGTGCILFVNGPVEIGEKAESPLSSVVFPLTNYYDGSATIKVDGWTIAIESAGREGEKEAARISRLWKIPVEGMRLMLRNPLATVEGHERTARQVALLLSLAAGTGVTCHSYSVLWQNGGSLEILRHWTGDEIGPGHCIASWKTGAFLERSLPIWNAWDDEKRGLARLAISYINHSARGYLDVRMLGIAQAWEFLANEWTSKPQLSEEESVLKRRIKQLCRDWRAEYPDADHDGKWADRLTRGFRWPQLLEQMSRLAATRRINLVELGLDLRELKEARDHIVHSGSLPDHMLADKPSTLKLLHAARFGLQLLLLAELQYDGLVVTSTKDGARTFVPMSTFMTQSCD